MAKITENTASDIVGNEYGIGDEVVVCKKNYRELIVAKVLRIAEQKAQVQYIHQGIMVTLWIDHNFCVAL